MAGRAVKSSSVSSLFTRTHLRWRWLMRCGDTTPKNHGLKRFWKYAIGEHILTLPIMVQEPFLPARDDRSLADSDESPYLRRRFRTSSRNEPRTGLSYCED